MNKSKNHFPGGFSVLMATYKGDNPLLLSKSIRSVINNSLAPDQFIIVVDGPVNKEINKILRAAQKANKLVELLFLKNNVGLALALNEGLKIIKYPWVVRADADDINFPDRFFVLSKELELDPKLDLIGSSIVEVDQNENPICYKSPPLKAEQIRNFIRYRNPFNHMSVAFKLDIVKEVGGYPSIYLKEDYALWALLISKGAKVKNISDVLVSANAGHEMYARRGGVKYVKSEFQLQFFMIKCGIQSIFLAILIGLARSIIFSVPNQIRGKFYEIFLRQKL